MPVTHQKVLAQADGADSSVVRPSDWNNIHTIAVATSEIDNDAITYAKIQNVSATDKLLGRSTAGAGDIEEIACTAAGRALIDDADAATQRTTLGLAAYATKADLSGLTAATSPDYVNDSAVLSRAATGDRLLGLEALTASQQSEYHKRRRSFFMDFEASGTSPLGTDTSGTGASASVEAAITNANQIGVRGLTTGSTATGRAAVVSGLSSVRLGNGAATLEGSFAIPTLSDGTNRFAFRFGFIDSTSADPADGVYFEYADDVSANWQACTASNSTRTKTASLTAVDTSFHTFKIVVNAGGTSASFYIDGAEVSGSPIATNIPTGAGRETGWGFHQVKSVGTTARTSQCDWLSWDIDLTSARS